MPPQTETSYIPPLRYHFLTPLYDSVVNATLRERTLKQAVVQEVAPRPGDKVLDMGCGTATLTLMLHEAGPETTVIGLDIDDKALAIARRKAAAAAANIRFVQGRLDALPDAPDLAPGSFDCLTSSLVFHHLSRSEKADALANALSLLKPGGRLVIGDWGRAPNALMRGAFYLVQMLDGFATTQDNVDGRLPDFIHEAGFTGIQEPHRFSTLFGSYSIYTARKPAP